MSYTYRSYVKRRIKRQIHLLDKIGEESVQLRELYSEGHPELASGFQAVALGLVTLIEVMTTLEEII